MDYKTIDSAVAQNIDSARVKADVSKNQLAKLSGVPYATLVRKLDGFGSFTVLELAGVPGSGGLSGSGRRVRDVVSDRAMVSENDQELT